MEADEPFNDGVKSSDLLSSCRNEISNVADHVSNRQHGVVLGVFREENRDEAVSSFIIKSKITSCEYNNYLKRHNKNHSHS